MLLPELGTYMVGTGMTLAGTGAALARGTNLFEGYIPATPDELVAIIPYGGRMDEPDLGTKSVRLEFPRVQITCRGAKLDFASPWSNANQVKKWLAQIENQSLSGTRYLSAICENGPFFLRRDENDRVEIILNFEITKAYSAT